MLAGIDNERIQKALIKIDIINRVADRSGVPKLKAEQAVDALFHSMKAALTRGESHRAARLRRLRRQAAETRRGPQSTHGSGGRHSVGQRDLDIPILKIPVAKLFPVCFIFGPL